MSKLLAILAFTSLVSPLCGFKMVPRSMLKPISTRYDSDLGMFNQNQIYPDKNSEGTLAEGAIGVVGLAANFLVGNKLEATLSSANCNGGSFTPGSPVEAIAYAIVLGLTGWSIFNKVTTGKGLPPGPKGLLGLAEGLTFVTIVGGVVTAVISFNKAC